MLQSPVPITRNRIPYQKDQGLDFPLFLLLLYLVVEFARPANPLKLPWAIGIVLFLTWVSLPDKNWAPQVQCFLLLLLAIVVMGPFALNSYAIWFQFRTMAILLLCICIPLIHFVSSMRKLRIFINTFLLVFVYVAIYVLGHGGLGPGGPVGDQNEASLALNVVMPFAFFSLLLSKGFVQRVIFAVMVGLMATAVVAGFSRGGFLSLVAVLTYCLALAPRKKVAVAICVVLVLAGLMFIPGTYWEEMATIDDTIKGYGPSHRDLRFEYWEVAMEMFYQNPLLGVGLGNFPYNTNDYQSEEQRQQLQRGLGGTAVHSLYFGILAELGIAGFTLFMAMLWYNLKDTGYIIRTAKAWERSKAAERDGFQKIEDEAMLDDLRRASSYAHAIRAGLLGYLVAGTFLTVFTYPYFWIYTALTVALKTAVDNRLGANRVELRGQRASG